MSAITGIHHANNEPVSIDQGIEMMKVLQKYPSDDIQIWQQKNIFLGCHSQWITPESVGEQLPFYDYERQLAITSDAMIDNRDELFDKLGIHHEERKGMPDSQLILLSYSKWEDGVPNHLIGDFAFMIWDERKQKLFGARDFSGTRSLYYNSSDQRFAFCTVIEPLLQLPYIKKQLNEEWLAEYLAIPNMIDAVDVTKTAIRDIQQLPPSHTISVINGKIKLSKYQVLSLNEKIRFKKDEEYIEAFRDIFQKAVDSSLRTFKDVGSQLSGGLDSGSVVSFAVKTLQKQNKKLHTYSSIPVKDFEDYTSDHYFPDERPFIRATVDYVGSIEEHYLSLDDKNSYTDIDDWLDIIETPYKAFENSFWIKGIFEEASKEGIGILLSGARGNFTISWGPAYDYYAHLLKSMRWIRFAQELKSYSRNIGVGRKNLLDPISKRAFPRLFKEENYQFPMLINPDFAAKMNVFEKLQNYGIEANGFTKRTIHGQKNYLIDNGFIWNTSGTTFTKLSLQYGLLLRDPTNDIRVVNYCKSVPLEQFINNGMDRALIRKATEGYLPDKVRLNQIYKGVQGMDWVHRMSSNWLELIKETQELLKNKDVTQYLNKESISDALSKVLEDRKGDMALNPQLRGLMRSIIVYRFLQTFEGGDKYEEGMGRTKIGSIGY
ncbi:asparagine synthetase B [Virgibacillus profundi]|uniref:asparagine synthase (glutamine-hydrolyzing) n=1 Tax=Virgibacillus profundi TaxID=2024555 RepID=A0A2A2II97_9BACI|nr:asparagine synthase-related protein [Virgibacillus profundi]PAV31529.1 asparagine synthetase B [Virgibacillus profundi]PXY55715.1 asparagine synthetase B [Virgibacillus profundi]